MTGSIDQAALLVIPGSVLLFGQRHSALVR